MTTPQDAAHEEAGKAWLRLLTGDDNLRAPRLPLHVVFRLASALAAEQAVWTDYAADRDPGTGTMSGRVVAVGAGQVIDLTFTNSPREPRLDATGRLELRPAKSIVSLTTAESDYASYEPSMTEAKTLTIAFRDGHTLALPLVARSQPLAELLDLLRGEAGWA